MPWHHIIPKHEWKRRFGTLEGTNAPDNLVNLSLENHTQLHQRMGEEGSEVDRVVALRMTGQIDVQEGIRLSQSVANIGNKHCVGRILSDAQKEICRQNGLKSRGRKHSIEARLKKSESMKGQKRSLGYKHTESWRIAKSAMQTGKNHWTYKKRMRESCQKS